jgi:hypothetical protein
LRLSTVGCQQVAGDEPDNAAEGSVRPNDQMEPENMVREYRPERDRAAAKGNRGAMPMPDRRGGFLHNSLP